MQRRRVYTIGVMTISAWARSSGSAFSRFRPLYVPRQHSPSITLSENLAWLRPFRTNSLVVPGDGSTPAGFRWEGYFARTFNSSARDSIAVMRLFGNFMSKL
jgi:hypothetical protein